MCDTELMFFIDDEESELFPAEILGEEFMCPDEDIDCTSLQSLEDTFLIARTRHACETLDIDAILCESLEKCLIVLICEDEKW